MAQDRAPILDAAALLTVATEDLRTAVQEVQGELWRRLATEQKNVAFSRDREEMLKVQLEVARSQLAVAEMKLDASSKHIEAAEAKAGILKQELDDQKARAARTARSESEAQRAKEIDAEEKKKKEQKKEAEPGETSQDEKKQPLCDMEDIIKRLRALPQMQRVYGKAKDRLITHTFHPDVHWRVQGVKDGRQNLNIASGLIRDVYCYCHRLDDTYAYAVTYRNNAACVHVFMRNLQDPDATQRDPYNTMPTPLRREAPVGRYRSASSRRSRSPPSRSRSPLPRSGSPYSRRPPPPPPHSTFDAPRPPGGPDSTVTPYGPSTGSADAVIWPVAWPSYAGGGGGGGFSWHVPPPPPSA
jgi:hypothetical protein